MKFKWIVFLFTLSILLCIDVKGEDVKKSIAVFPFYNQARSSAEYLSDYIPELLMNRLIPKGDYNVYQYNDLVMELNRKKITYSDVFKGESSKDLLKGLNIDMGIIGRYIVQGNQIRIDTYLIDYQNDRIIKGIVFDESMEEKLLARLDQYAVNSIQFYYNRINKKNIDIINRGESILNYIKESRFGFLIKNRWFFSGVILLLFFFFSQLLVFIFEKGLKKVVIRTKTTLDDKLIEICKNPLKWIIIIIGLKLVFLTLDLSETYSQIIFNILSALIVYFIAKLAFKSSDVLIHSWGNKVANKISSRINEDLVPLFVKMSKILIVVISSIIILSDFGIEIGPLLASLGIVGFAIGFAVKDSLANIIGGIILILDKSFVVGDKVTIDGDTGFVYEVGLRNTKIKTFDNEIIIIPNGELMNKRFKNYVLPDPTIRVVVNFGVAYGTDVDKVENVVMKTIKEIDDVVDNPEPQVVFKQMADFSLDFQAKFWIPLYDNQYAKKREATKKIYNALNKAKINIPFPTHTVYLEK